MKTLGMVMDHISTIKPKKDSSLALLLEAQNRGIKLFHITVEDMYLKNGKPFVQAQALTVSDDDKNWYTLDDAVELQCDELDTIIMRKDPPFDMNYVYATYMLELATKAGTHVVNNPRSIRDCNEKLFISYFPQCCAPTLVTSNKARIKAFVAEHGKAVIKPLDGMGGASIFVLEADDINTSVIIDTITAQQTVPVMTQKFLPEISAGDKRILMINGEPVDYALARIPMVGESRGNLAAGGRGVGQPLSERDRWLANEIGPELRNRGLWLVGLDVIGDYVTEINVTSPTCIRELDTQFNLNIAGMLFDVLEKHAT